MGRAGRLSVSLATALLLASVVVLLTAIGSMRAEAAATKKPNIIFVLTDDQFPGTENAMPALQNNIARQGVEFTKMTSTFPLCCPGRATILRGQYAHNTHIYGNSLPLGGWAKFSNHGEQNSTMATWLHDAGYRTSLFGKYMNNYGGLTIPPGWDRWYAWNGVDEGWGVLKYLNTHLDKPAPVFVWVGFGAEHSPYYYDQADAGAFAGVGVPAPTPSTRKTSPPNRRT